MDEGRMGRRTSLRTRLGLTATLVAAGMLLATGAAQAAPITFKAILGPEVLGATGSGTVKLVYDDVLHELAIDASFSGLTGLTTVAHIHCCTAAPGTGTAGVAVTPGTLPGFPVNVMAGTYSFVVDLTDSASFTATFVNNFGGGTIPGAEAALLAGLHGGTAYFNIHSTAFSGGEIRGFPAVPEPASLLLLGTALAGLAARRRFRA